MARLKHVSAVDGHDARDLLGPAVGSAAGPHFGSPDKVPAVRLRTIEDAGRLAIPFTTGILVGIGETLARARRVAPRDPRRSIGATATSRRSSSRTSGRSPGTAMHDAPEPRGRGVPGRRRDRAGRARPAHARPGAAEPLRPEPAAAPARRRHRRLGRRLAAHARPREPRAPVAGDRAISAAATAAARARRSASGSRSTRSSRCGPIRTSRARCGRPSRPLIGPDGLAVEGAVAGADRVAGPRGRLEAADDRAHVREGRRGRPARGRRASSTARLRRPRAHPRLGDAGRVAPERLDAEIRSALADGRGGTGRPHRRGGARAVPGRGRRPRGALRGRRRPPARGRRRRRHLRRQPEHQLHQRLLRRVPLLRVRAAGDRPGVLHAHARRGGRPAPRRRAACGAHARCACRAGSTPTCPGPSTSTSSTR